jgi:hypothetical protein
MDDIQREQANTIREQHLRATEDNAELYCECGSCGRRKTLRVRALNRALQRVAASLDDELGQRLIDFATIYWYINDAFAIHAVEGRWRVLQGYLYCPECMATAE